MKLKRMPYLLTTFLVAAHLSACGGGSSSSTTTGGTGSSGSSGVSITGSALTTASGKPGQNGGARHYAPLPNATITMNKVWPDGTKTAVDIGTVVTDASGNFTIPNVTIPATGSGASTDYYYEVKATDGTNTVTYPIAPTANATISMTPASTLANDILANVVDNPNSATNPTPGAEVINSVAAQVSQNVTDLTGKATLPNATGTADAVLAAANGVAGGGGNAEISYKALQFGSENAGFSADPANVPVENVRGYLVRVAKESCGSANNPLSLLAAEALAEKLKAGTRYTAAEVLTAYNAVAVTQAPSTSLTDYASAISGINGTSALSGLQTVAYLTRRSLTDMTADTSLAPDQALSLLLFLTSDTNNQCNTSPLNMAQMVAALTSSPLLADPAIMNYEVYNDSTAACASPQVHFAADDVLVYVPLGSTLTVSGVTVSAAGFNGDAPLALTLDNNRYRTVNTTACVAKDTSITYTITATLSDASTLTKQVTRQHNVVPEPTTLTMNGANVSSDQLTPSTSTDARPLFSWTPASTLFSQITSPPAGSRVKYTYEFAHYIKGSGSPINPGTTACPGVNTGGSRKLYNVNDFFPASDCQPSVCAAAQGTTADQVECRMYVNTWLVDENDKLLGQAGGTFRFFCPDTNADGLCD